LAIGICVCNGDATGRRHRLLDMFLLVCVLLEIKDYFVSSEHGNEVIAKDFVTLEKVNKKTISGIRHTTQDTRLPHGLNLKTANTEYI